MTIKEKLSLPHDPILLKLLKAASQFPCSDIIVHDVLGFEKTYPELLGDILQLRNNLRARLPAAAIDEQGILHEKSKYIAALVRSGYEFLVAFFATRAIGGVCVPLGSGVLPEEANYFLSVTNATCILAGKDRIESAETICEYIHQHGSSDPPTLLSIQCNASPVDSNNIGIDDSVQMDPAGPGLVLFTSGTTGLPKGVVLPRQCFADAQSTEPGRAAISHRPGHWIGGARNLIEPIVTGKKLYSLGETAARARAEGVLAALEHYRITDADFTPVLLRWMKDLLTDQTNDMSEDKKGKCSEWFRGLSTIKCSSGMVEPSTRRFWTSLTGLPFENIYAATELGGPAIRGLSQIKGSIGVPSPGIKVQLSEGTHGEILIKSPRMLTHYIGDEKATREAFDEEGYLKTGDLGAFKDGEYIFCGRANADYILSRTYQFSALIVESNILDLPYISEACIVGVPDYESRQLCGAVVRLRPGSTSSSPISLDRIRADLRASLVPYMLPVLLRVLKDGEELPRTASGKAIKRDILKEYFGVTDGLPPKNTPVEVERCSLSAPNKGETKHKPWDFCGLQRAL